jgi:hypothetical protein
MVKHLYNRVSTNPYLILMPYKDKTKLYEAQKRYRQDKKNKADENQELAYWAGLFDGEGSAFIHKRNRRRRAKSPEYILAASLGNTNKQIIYEMKQFFGCGWIGRRGETITWKPMYQFYARYNQAYQVLKRLLPYLRIKKEWI